MYRKILIVEDDIEFRIMLKKQLRNRGFEILLANGGVMAMKIAKEEEPDLILMDISMPILNGFSTCTLLKNDEKTKEIPILVVSGLGETEVKSKLNEWEFDGFVPKPIDRNELMTKISRILKEQRAS